MKFNIEVPAPVYFIIQELERCGHEAYMVGGCVRDSVLGRTPHDYDICTSATPDEILKAFPYEDIIPTGLQHGTVTILINHESFEVTTFRIDGEYSDSRRPDKVEFTKSLVEDLKRRDFTINAMAYNPKTGLIDPFNGMKDIKYKKIQCVGSAKDRFSEDALRILRAIRFASQLDFIILPGTDSEIYKQYKNLENISIERINSEFCKIAQSNSFCIQLLLYEEVFSLFIPELKDMIGFQQNNPFHEHDVFGHTVQAIEKLDRDELGDLIAKLAVFFHDFGKAHCFQDGEDGIRHFKGHGRVSADMTDTIMKRLKFDNDTRKKVVELVYYHDATFEVGKKYIKRWLNKIGEEQFRRLLLVRRADILGQKSEVEESRIEKINKIECLLEELLNEQPCFSLKDLAVDGNDVKKAMMLSEGKDIGHWLNNLLNLVIDGELNNVKEDLVYYMVGITDGWIDKN